MSHEAAEQERLHAAVSDAIGGVSRAVRQMIAAQGTHRDAVDLIGQMQATVGVVIACDALTAVGKDAAGACRAALARAMALGATTIQTEHHTVSVRESSRTVRITDPARLPPDVMRQPPPEPDKAEIARRLRAGEAVPGAELSNGGDPIISIRSRT